MIFINNTESTLSVRHNRLVLARRNNLVEEADLRGSERLGMHSFLSLSNPRIATISETARCPLVLRRKQSGHPRNRTGIVCPSPRVLSAHGYHSTAGSEVGETLASSTGNRAVRQVS